ncbi:MAG: hypothetical protein NUV80_02890 [Candidatus Berkelbacteria bacterium]|nr:hypothetical protein [Candidatus Berkelbacteria bacterium]
MSIAMLPNIEREALKMLVSESDTTLIRLSDQFSHVVKIERTETGAGVYVVFKLDRDVRPLKGGGTFVLSGVFAVSSQCSEIGFLLYVKEGLIDCMEGYSSADIYPNYDECNFRIEKEAKTT